MVDEWLKRGFEPMWKIGDVQPVSVLGVDGYPYGFNITNDRGKPLVLFAYTTREEAEAAAEQVRVAIEKAVEVRPHAQ
jgi:hypothetical protein